MPLSNWPTLSDDSGTGTDGTPVDHSWEQAVKDSIEAAIFSSGNPAVPPEATTDEVIAARATFANLSDRLNDIEGQIGGGTTTSPTPTSFAASENVAKNPDLLGWKSGGASAPDSFVLSGTGAAIARTGEGQSDTTHLGAGQFTMKLTFGSDEAKATQTVLDAEETIRNGAVALDGRKVSLTVRVQASIANLAKIVISDGVTSTSSSFHSGSGQPENLTVTHTLSSGATELIFYASVVQSGAAYFGGFVFSFSDNPAKGWVPPAHVGRRILDVNVTAAGNVGAPETDMMSYKLSPGSLRHNGVIFQALMEGYTAANATAKTVKIKVTDGTSTLTFTVFTGGQNNRAWSYAIRVKRTGVGSQQVIVTGNLNTVIFCQRQAGVLDETKELRIWATGDGNANNDIVQDYMESCLIEAGASL